MPVDRIIVRVQATQNDELSSIHRAALSDRQRRQAELGLTPHNFVYVGRLAQEKNVDLLLRAFAEAFRESTRDSGWGLLIVGDGPRRKELERQAQTCTSASIVFVGSTHWRQVPAYLALADVLVLPSLSEPWGLVVNEAMACGMPVLVSDRCGAAYDLVEEGVNGFVFPATSQGGLSDRLRAFAQTEANQMEEMGNASLRIIEQFSPEQAAKQMMLGFRKLLGLDISSRHRQEAVP